MWEGIVGSLVSAGAKLIPSLFGSDSDQKAEAQFNQQSMFQDAMAKRGITWRARDVMNAYAETGIHPLSLLGTNPAQFSPVASTGVSSGGSWRKGVADAGQDIGRAISATAGSEERRALAELTLQRGGLENELLRVQIAKNLQDLQRGSGQVGPAMPVNRNQQWLIDGQGETNTETRSPMAQGRLFVDKPLERGMPDPRQPSQEAAAFPSRSWIKNDDGSYTMVRSKDAKDRLEDDFWGNTAWFVTNRLLPMIRGGTGPYPAPPGKRWWIDAKGDYRLIDRPMHSNRGPGWRD